MHWHKVLIGDSIKKKSEKEVMYFKYTWKSRNKE